MDIKIKSVKYCGGGEYGQELTTTFSGISSDSIEKYDERTAVVSFPPNTKVFISTPAEELKGIFNDKGTKAIIVEGVRDGGSYSGRIVCREKTSFWGRPYRF